MRLLIADDHPIVTSGIAAMFERTEFEIVARCSNGREALESLDAAAPDVMILDVQMPELTGIEVLREVKRSGRSVPVILMTASMTDAQAVEAIRLGVDGLVLKERAPDELLTCARKVMAGQSQIDPEVTRRVLDFALSNRPVEQPRLKLTARETHIAAMVGKGLRNKQIAHAIQVAEGTVKMHLHNVYDKLGVTSRTELALFARDHDLC